MDGLSVTYIFPHNRPLLEAYDRLCRDSGIRRDEKLELMLGVLSPDGRLMAAGGLAGKTLRSLVTAPEARGEGVMAKLVSVLLQEQKNRGIEQVFLFSKGKYLAQYEQLGFTLLAQGSGGTIFMENSAVRFPRFLESVREESGRVIRERGWEERAEQAEKDGASALVMNMNPCTKGHLGLIRETCETAPLTHLFVLSEDLSFFTAAERRAIVEKATEGFPGLLIHGSGDYMISRASFPSYFLPGPMEAAEEQAELDAKIFVKIARTLGISRRVIGAEPFSELGRCYNRILAGVLEAQGISCVERERFRDASGTYISASRVRKALEEGDFETAKRHTPEAAHPYLSREYLGERISELAERGRV